MIPYKYMSLEKYNIDNNQRITNTNIFIYSTSGVICIITWWSNVSHYYLFNHFWSSAIYYDYDYNYISFLSPNSLAHCSNAGGWNAREGTGKSWTLSWSPCRGVSSFSLKVVKTFTGDMNWVYHGNPRGPPCVGVALDFHETGGWGIQTSGIFVSFKIGLDFYQKVAIWNFVCPFSPAQSKEMIQFQWVERLRIRISFLPMLQLLGLKGIVRFRILRTSYWSSMGLVDRGWAGSNLQCFTYNCC